MKKINNTTTQLTCAASWLELEEGGVEIHVTVNTVSSVHLPLGVAEDDGLGDGQCIVQITQRVKLDVLQCSYFGHETSLLSGDKVL